MEDNREVNLDYYSLEEMAKRLYPGEPVFVLRASDEFSKEAVRAYGERLVQLPNASQAQFDKGIAALHQSFKMGRWQTHNPDKVKLPDNPSEPGK